LIEDRFSASQYSKITRSIILCFLNWFDDFYLMTLLIVGITKRIHHVPPSASSLPWSLLVLTNVFILWRFRFSCTTVDLYSLVEFMSLFLGWVFTSVKISWMPHPPPPLAGSSPSCNWRSCSDSSLISGVFASVFWGWDTNEIVGVCSGVVKPFLAPTNSFSVLLTPRSRHRRYHVYQAMCINTCIRTISTLFSSHVAECWDVVECWFCGLWPLIKKDYLCFRMGPEFKWLKEQKPLHLSFHNLIDSLVLCFLNLPCAQHFREFEGISNFS